MLCMHSAFAQCNLQLLFSELSGSGCTSIYNVHNILIPLSKRQRRSSCRYNEMVCSAWNSIKILTAITAIKQRTRSMLIYSNVSTLSLSLPLTRTRTRCFSLVRQEIFKISSTACRIYQTCSMSCKSQTTNKFKFYSK